MKNKERIKELEKEVKELKEMLKPKSFNTLSDNLRLLVNAKIITYQDVYNIVIDMLRNNNLFHALEMEYDKKNNRVKYLIELTEDINKRFQ